jgi:hypothetical protein
MVNGVRAHEPDMRFIIYVLGNLKRRQRLCAWHLKRGQGPYSQDTFLHIILGDCEHKGRGGVSLWVPIWLRWVNNGYGRSPVERYMSVCVWLNHRPHQPLCFSNSISMAWEEKDPSKRKIRSSKIITTSKYYFFLFARSIINSCTWICKLTIKLGHLKTKKYQIEIQLRNTNSALLTTSSLVAINYDNGKVIVFGLNPKALKSAPINIPYKEPSPKA